ncbi:MAG: Gfo/Idh/MocA family oxidoreductase [candidate division KSB1 bacterium]
MNEQLTPSHFSRRAFLKKTFAASCLLACPTIVPATALGNNPPSRRITLGCIGVGRMGRADLQDFLGFEEVQVLAVCDVDAKRASEAKQLVEAHYAGRATNGSYKGCAVYKDFREVLARDDIDAVAIVTPDHWHGLLAIAAAQAGKDIFVEKPLTFTIHEGCVLRDTVARYGVVSQIGSQQRSEANFRFACELVRNGRIGKLHTVRVGLPKDPTTRALALSPAPAGLDYDMWLGPAPLKPYAEMRVHPVADYGRPGWMCVADYCHGMISNWGAHHLDIAQWGMGTEHTGPLAIEGRTTFPNEGMWDVHGEFRVEYAYANEVQLICASTTQHKPGVVFEGSEGWVHVDRGALTTHPHTLATSSIGPNETRLYRSNNHKQNFLDCIRSRGATITPVVIGHRSNTLCNLGDIAMRLGRKLHWDTEAECFRDDDEANRALSRPMRSPWQLG